MQPTAPSPAMQAGSADSVHVGRGDTLTKIARSLQGAAATPAAVDQTMIALFRSNREAFGGNINVLRQGTILRVPNADEIAALNQKEATGEVRRQMEAWRTGEGAASAASGRLRLVTPSAGGSATGGTGTANAGTSSGSSAEAQALKDRVKDLEGQLAESKRLIDIRNNELSALQRKLQPRLNETAWPGQIKSGLARGVAYVYVVCDCFLPSRSSWMVRGELRREALARFPEPKKPSA
jgi:pilus assembly protein FimV